MLIDETINSDSDMRMDSRYVEVKLLQAEHI